MSSDSKKQFDDSFKILFSGDLILLEDQVRRAYNGTGYDFSENFEYTKKYISEADFSIGVLEGPLGGGGTKGYSSSNYGDGKKLYINFPDEWADEIKNAGFDLVTTANNHVLDMGIDGAQRTIEVLKNKGINYIGSYSTTNDKESNQIKIIEREGIKFAILAYTYGTNGISEDTLFNGKYSYVTSIIVGTKSKNYEKVRKSVQKDFEIAKKYNPDIIIVLPHWGTQFSDTPNDFQKIWRKNFIEFGADIILGDHTHSVQPVSISFENNRNIFTLYSPGNYANIYRKHNGDFSALVEIYIDKNNKTVTGGSIIPMWTASSYVGNYKAIPIYDILTDQSLGRTITTHDIERVQEAQKHITTVMLGQEVNFNIEQARFYFDKSGFMRNKVSPIQLTDIMKTSKVYKLLTQAKSICFIGDSVTEGTKNGGVGWYEPLEKIISGKIYNRSWGGMTIKLLLKNHLNEIINTKSDLFVIAIGTNDVRYRNNNCALTAQEYIKSLRSLRSTIIKNNPEAKFIFVAPWISTDGDLVSKLNYQDKIKLNDQYTNELRIWAQNNTDTFVNPNKYIGKFINVYPQSKYLLDWIHPNSAHGVQLYSKAFLEVCDD
ncbi:hypothetical protein PIROE2DRAFT_56864 [Piromyces sp. E2]|nr:hypothetical protein PIROE2DRAFT_56864 [Piromyces sp. E2]|eukprot:OUM70389.1 hypothetical protein PIROE2DRAFT_56864 [Piromyces sp. E2]